MDDHRCHRRFNVHNGYLRAVNRAKTVRTQDDAIVRDVPTLEGTRHRQRQRQKQRARNSFQTHGGDSASGFVFRGSVFVHVDLSDDLPDHIPHNESQSPVPLVVHIGVSHSSPGDTELNRVSASGFRQVPTAARKDSAFIGLRPCFVVPSFRVGTWNFEEQQRR